MAVFLPGSKEDTAGHLRGPETLFNAAGCYSSMGLIRRRRKKAIPVPPRRGRRRYAGLAVMGKVHECAGINAAGCRIRGSAGGDDRQREGDRRAPSPSGEEICPVGEKSVQRSCHNGIRTDGQSAMQHSGNHEQAGYPLLTTIRKFTDPAGRKAGGMANLATLQ